MTKSSDTLGKYLGKESAMASGCGQVVFPSEVVQSLEIHPDVPLCPFLNEKFLEKRGQACFIILLHCLANWHVQKGI